MELKSTNCIQINNCTIESGDGIDITLTLLFYLDSILHLMTPNVLAFSKLGVTF